MAREWGSSVGQLVSLGFLRWSMCFRFQGRWDGGAFWDPLGKLSSIGPRGRGCEG